MLMTPSLRKLALTVHVVCSVGWLGAVAGFLALSIAGLRSADTQTVRAAYLGMQLLTWTVLVPLSLASLLTGVVQSLGTTWGLFRHYWLVTKLLVTVLATFLLLVHTGPIDRVAATAAHSTLSGADLHRLRIQLIADAAAALLALLAATALSVYKPFGMTSYGWRKQAEETKNATAPGLVRRSTLGTFWTRTAPWGLIGVILLLLFLHLLSGGLHHH